MKANIDKKKISQQDLRELKQALAREEGLLSRLIEKKDLLVYIDLRIAVLVDVLARQPEDIPKTKFIEPARQRTKGKIEELKRLKTIINQGQLKSRSKELWPKVKLGER